MTANSSAASPKAKSRAGRAARIKLEGPKPHGRPPFEPSERQRRLVRRLKLLGLTDDHIAGFIGISHKTMRKHFDYELQRSRQELLARLAAIGYRLALNGDGDMIRFFLSTQAGWAERIGPTAQDHIQIKPGAAATTPAVRVEFCGARNQDALNSPVRAAAR